MAPYRADLEAAQQRITSLESEVEEQAERIERLQAAVKGRDEQLDKLRAKFDGAPASQGRARVLRLAVAAGAVLVVGAVFVIQFRPSDKQPSRATSETARAVQPSDAGVAAPTSTHTLADPLDPPAHPARADDLTESADAAVESSADRLNTIRLLQERAYRGKATEGELLMLRGLCLDEGLTVCALDAHRYLRRIGGLGRPDERAARQDLELKVYSGEGSESDVRLLQAICADLGDYPCRDRATEILERMKRQRWMQER